MKPSLAFAVLSAMILTFLAMPGCGLNRSDYDRQRDIRGEFLAQLAEVRQANEIIGRNIASTYQEIEVLRARIVERESEASHPAPVSE